MGLLSGVGKLFRGVAGDLFGADEAAEASRQASEAQQAAIGQGISRIDEAYAPFMPIRQDAATGFGQLLNTGQSNLMTQIQQALGQGQGEAITRTLGAQGRSLSGALPRAMADMEGQNYLKSLGAAQGVYGMGLGLPTGAESIAQLLGAQGQAKAGGILGAEQAYQSATGQLFNLASMLGGAAMGGGFGGGAPKI